MSALRDRLLRFGPLAPAWVVETPLRDANGFFHEWKHRIGPGIRDCPAIDVQNVAHYLYLENDQEMFSWRDDYFCLSPPFPHYWMEFRNPGISRSRDLGEVRLCPEVRAVGVAFQGINTRESPIPARPDFSSLSSRPSWVMSASIFCEYTNAKVGMMPPLFYGLDAEGMMLAWTDRGYACPVMPLGATIGGWDTSVIGSRLVAEVSSLLHPCLLATCFLHCKNVALKASEPPKLQRKREKTPRYHYYVLEIEPMKQVLRTEGKAEEVGLKRALHICRGHFKDYRDKGLFGKYKGVFWWEHHVRGHASEGVVDKDYAVKAPADPL